MAPWSEVGPYRAAHARSRSVEPTRSRSVGEERSTGRLNHIALCSPQAPVLVEQSPLRGAIGRGWAAQPRQGPPALLGSPTKPRTHTARLTRRSTRCKEIRAIIGAPRPVQVEGRTRSPGAGARAERCRADRASHSRCEEVFGATNLAASGTRKERLLMAPAELKTVTALRRRLMNMKPPQQIEQLLGALSRFETNEAAGQGVTRIRDHRLKRSRPRGGAAGSRSRGSAGLAQVPSGCSGLRPLRPAGHCGAAVPERVCGRRPLRSARNSSMRDSWWRSLAAGRSGRAR